MPKKRQNKRSHADVKGNRTASDYDSSENPSIVDDSEVRISDGKYGHRPINSNWGRYSPKPPKERDEDEQDSKCVDNFATFLSSPSDCNYFQFKSEKRWENEAIKSSFSGHKLFNLDLELLSSGLACIPFYDRVDIDKSILTQYDIDSCNKKAEDNLQRYKPIKERFLKRQNQNLELPSENNKSVIVVSEVLTKDGTESDEISFSGVNNLVPEAEQSVNEEDESHDSNKAHIERHTRQNEDDENLEDWLDSVLDE